MQWQLIVTVLVVLIPTAGTIIVQNQKIRADRRTLVEQNKKADADRIAIKETTQQTLTIVNHKSDAMAADLKASLEMQRAQFDLIVQLKAALVQEKSKPNGA